MEAHQNLFFPPLPQSSVLPSSFPLSFHLSYSVLPFFLSSNSWANVLHTKGKAFSQFGIWQSKNSAGAFVGSSSIWGGSEGRGVRIGVTALLRLWLRLDPPVSRASSSQQSGVQKHSYLLQNNPEKMNFPIVLKAKSAWVFWDLWFQVSRIALPIVGSIPLAAYHVKCNKWRVVNGEGRWLQVI